VAAAAEGNGQGVGDVGRLGELFQGPEALDGALDLGFAGVAMANDGLFDPVGGELIDAEAAPLSDEKDNAAGVAHEDGGAGVAIVGVELFDGADVGFVFVDEALEFRFEFKEAMGDGRLVAQANDAAGDEGGVEEFPIDDTVAGESKAGIDS
jgi:hypothetical protein